MKLAQLLGLGACSWSLLFGCALTSKADALTPRYFNPQTYDERRSPPAPRPFELRLGQVSSASNLDERIAYRLNAVEVGFYEDRRWTELPEQYLRRALETELFEERKLTRIVSGVAPILDVELQAFEEQRGAPGKARVVLRFTLRDERRSLLEQSLELELPLGSDRSADKSERVAKALGDALAEGVTRLGAAVVKRLSESPPAAVETSTP